MKKLFIILAVLAVSGAAHGQISNPDVVYVTVAPSGACASAPPIQVVISTGTAYTCNNGTWAAAGGSGNATTVNGASIPASQGCVGTNGGSQLIPGTCTGGGGAVVVACTGTNDNTAINTALSAGGMIVVTGSCVLNPAAAGLVINSNTTLNLGTSTINYVPSAANSLITNFAAQHQTPYKTFGDGVVTAGSLTITSATAGFVAGDQYQSVNCALAGDGTFDFFSYVASVVSGTSIKVADTPGFSVNPATCHLVARDSNITITGGTWTMNGNNVTTAAALPVMKFKSVNNFSAHDLSVAGGGTAAAYQLHIQDAAKVYVNNVQVNSPGLHQDGVHIVGPASEGRISTIRGQTGDDVVAFTARDTNWQANDITTYGYIRNWQIEDVQATSGFHCLTLISAPASPIISIKASGIFGSNDVNTGAEGCSGVIVGDNLTYVANGGWTGVQGIDDLISLQDIGGVTRSSAVVLNATNAGSVVIDRPSSTNIASPLVTVSNSSTTTGLAINNLKILNPITLPGQSLLTIPQNSAGPQTAIGTLILDPGQAFIATGGLGSFATIGTVFQSTGPTVNEMITLSGQLTYNSTTASTSGLFLIAKGATVNSITMMPYHVVHGAGSGRIAQFITAAGTVGNVTMINPSITAGAQTNDTLIELSGAAGSVASATIINPVLNNAYGCTSNAAITPTPIRIFGAQLTSISVYPTSCNDYYAGTVNLAGPLNSLGQSNAYGNVVATALVNPAIGTISQASTGGSGGLTDNTAFFYTVAAVDAIGKSTSAERTITVCPSSTCSNLSTVTVPWAAVLGATSFNIYRSTTTGTELLCTSVAGNLLSWTDTGGACAGAASPAATSNTSAPGIVPATGRRSTFTCTGGGTITVTNAYVSASSDITITLKTAGGTITTPPAFKTVTAGTGFSVLCGATDTSVYNYSIPN